MSIRKGSYWVLLVMAGSILCAPGAPVRGPEQGPPQNLCVNTAYFQSGAETGDLSEWVRDGGGHVFSYTGEGWSSLRTLAVQASTEMAHSGRYSIRCYIPYPKTGSDAKLYRERTGDKSAAYYSCWFWFDPAFTPKEWVNVFQWKTKMGTYPPLCDPTFVINVLYKNGVRYLDLYHWPVGEGLIPPGRGDAPGGGFHQSNPIPVRSATWMQIEAYYKIDRVNGQVVVWQDGNEIFNVSGVNTQDARSDHLNNRGTLLWGVGNYSSPNNAGPLLLYLDDVMISSCPTHR